MTHSTRTEVAEQARAFREAEALPFREVLDRELVEAAVKEEGATYRVRLYTPFLTLALFLSQALGPDHSCRAAVARLLVWLARGRRALCSAGTGAYCDARQRLPLGVLTRLVRRTGLKTDDDAAPGWPWKSRRVLIVDGTTVSMPDTPENQEAYPQSTAQKPGLGFPIARLVALISLSAGVVRDLALGPYQGKETGETALFREIMGALRKGDVVLGDRVFSSFFGIAELTGRAVDGLFRLHQRRKYDFNEGRRLGREDQITVWKKPDRPDWMDEATYAGFADEITVRELRVVVTQPGFRVKSLILVTTLTDAEVYTAKELAALYLQRWTIELDLRSIKDVMQMDVLRCKTPEMVKKEIWVGILAYNLIRGVMAQAAKASGKSPRRISFKGALQTMTAFGEALRECEGDDRVALVQALLRAVASHEVGNRFGRSEPRANKRRPKPQRYLTVPRDEARKSLVGAA